MPASRLHSLRSELPRLWRLAWPVVVGELGWQTMGLVDTLVVGRAGAAALAGIGVGGAAFFLAAISATGMLLGLDFAVARAVGAGRYDEVSSYLRHGVALAAGLSLLLTTSLLVIGVPMIPRIGLAPEVAAIAASYLDVVAWSLPPLLLFNALRRFLQAVGSVRIIAWAMVVANVVNAVADWSLVLGHWGAPALGAVGAAWATVASRIFMLAVLLAWVLAYHRDVLLQPTPWRREAFWLLCRLGFPAAAQLALEVGLFATVTMLAGGIGAVAAASHHVVLNIAAFSFMIPLGISAAGAVRVGHEVGRGDRTATRVAGWTAIGFGALVMSLASACFLLIPGPLVALFTTDPEVRAVAASLMLVAAVFQLFDGVQVVATGVLRGVGDTRTPMLVNLVSHWCIGLPVGWIASFRFDLGVTGLWVGLCSGLMAAAVLLLRQWAVDSDRDMRGAHAPSLP